MNSLPVFFFIGFNVVLSSTERLDEVSWSSSEPNWSTQTASNPTADSCPEDSPCLRKCCPAGQVKDSVENMECVNVSDDRFSVLDVSWTTDHGQTVTKLTGEQLPNIFEFRYGNSCKPDYLLEPHEKDQDKFFLFSNNGSLYNRYLRSPLHTDQFCLETFADINLTLPLICHSPKDDTNTVNPISQTISIPFLIVTFLVHAMIKELHNLHSKILMSHVAALTVGYTFLVLIKAIHYNQLWPWLCVLTAVAVQFSFLAAFFWLNVMCFDLWWTFRGSRSFNGSIKEQETEKFVIYSIYAWGCPALVTSFSLAVEHAPILAEYFPKPDFGKTRCWFGDPKALFYYFYGPMSLVLVFNIFVFVSTTVIIIRHKEVSKVLTQKGSQRHCGESEQQRFASYLTLFIVMGVNWTMEVMSWIFNDNNYFNCISDMCNALQVVFIFIIFICKRHVIRLLIQKLCPNKDIFPVLFRSSSRTASISSAGSTQMNNKNSVRLHTSDTQEYNDGNFQV